MPIDIDRFERESGFESATQASRVLAFLAANDDRAYRRAEIADATDLDPDVVSSVLSRLEARGLVRHKRPYWAVGDPDRLREASAFSGTVRALDERLGPEDMAEWRNAAASDDEASDEDTPESGDDDDPRSG